jgi:TRAP-type transport system periplasmic protein
MARVFACCMIGVALLLPAAADAAHITLTLSFFSSDRTVAYQAAVKPFVDAINHDDKGLLHIDVYFSGSLGNIQKDLPKLVLDGTADIAFIVPGQNPDRFRDTAAIEIPGLFRDAREASLVYTRLIAARALPGYGDFFVIGAYGTAPETINSRKPLKSLAELKGLKIRVNNLMEAAGLAKLGALPIVLPFNETSSALSSGLIDAATVPAAQLFDVGIGRLTAFHYLLPTSTAPLALVMNRKVFEQLPAAAQTLIRKYSGEWLADRYGAAYHQINQQALAQIEADPRRTVVAPSAADLARAHAAFKSVAEDWAAESADNRRLLALVRADLAAVRQAATAPRTESVGEGKQQDSKPKR